MSEKYQINGPDGEVLGVHFQTITNQVLMVGAKVKFKPFLEHVVFNVMGFSQLDIEKEGVRQKHKYRYYILVDKDEFKRAWYKVMDKYRTSRIDSIIKIS